MARSLSGQSASHSPAHYDSVEYASVRTSSERPIPPPAQSHSGEAPLLDAPTLLRLQQMAQRAPLLYPTDSLEYAGQPAGMSDQVPMAPRTPPPPSTTSSELQAEVRRQLSELMAARDEESRRLRAQVEALSMENHSLRIQAELEAQHSMQPSRQAFGFPGLGWFGRGLGSLMGHTRQEQALDSGTHSGPRPPPPPPLASTPAQRLPSPSPRAILNQEITGDVPSTVTRGLVASDAAASLVVQPQHPAGLSFWRKCP